MTQHTNMTHSLSSWNGPWSLVVSTKTKKTYQTWTNMWSKCLKPLRRHRVSWHLLGTHIQHQRGTNWQSEISSPHPSHVNPAPPRTRRQRVAYPVARAGCKTNVKDHFALSKMAPVFSIFSHRGRPWASQLKRTAIITAWTLSNTIVSAFKATFHVASDSWLSRQKHISFRPSSSWSNSSLIASMKMAKHKGWGLSYDGLPISQ